MLLAISAAALPMFMASLDNLVITFALPAIQGDLDASVIQLQWFINAYTIAFATFMLPMAALGDRAGRRRVFCAGIILFTLASICAALAATPSALIAARAVQGVGAAAIVPLSLTLLATAVPENKRAIAIGIWGGINGLGVASGPIIGGAVVEGFHWAGIFWLNVPISVGALWLVSRGLQESHGARRPLDIIGVLSATLFALPLVWAVVEGNTRGWTSPQILGAFALATAALIVFGMHENRSPVAFLPLHLFRDRNFTAANVSGFLFSAGVFGAVFLLSQFLQISMGYSPLAAGLRAAPWTLAPMVIAPLSGLLVNRIGVRPVLAAGLALQTLALVWIASTQTTDVGYGDIVLPMLLAGIGMGMTFAPLSTAVLIGRSPAQTGVASGTNNMLRELGIAVGIALATVIFTSAGAYLPGQPFRDGLVPALLACAALTGAAALVALLLPGRTVRAAPVEPESLAMRN